MHFYHYGSNEGRRPNPYFDPAWYAATYPDVLSSGMKPLLHYLRTATWRAAARCSISIRPGIARRMNFPPDAVALAHFLTQRASGRFAPVAGTVGRAASAPYMRRSRGGEGSVPHYIDDMADAKLRDCSLIMGVVKASGMIDPNYYLINGSDVHDAELDPVEHFCRYGWREVRKPNIYFDMHWYLHTNP